MQAGRSRPSIVRIVLSLAIASSLAALAAILPARATGGADVLPNLRPQEPRGFELRLEGGRWLLGFSSHADNIGLGALVIRGSRPDTAQQTMQADQLVDQSGGGTHVVANVGSLRYIEFPDHQHWHLLGFMVYELRRVTDFGLVAPDEKQGFCLGDRYDAAATYGIHPVPATKPPAPVYVELCGRGEPSRLGVEEGISPGYGDRYAANLEGQSIDITNAPDGRYYVLHRINPNGLLLESNYKDNVSSAQIEITRTSGQGSEPSVEVLASCVAKERCLLTPALRVSAPSRLPQGRSTLPVAVETSVDGRVSVELRSVKNGAVVRAAKTVESGVTRFALRVTAKFGRPTIAVLRVTIRGAGLAATGQNLRIALQ